jgi:DNA-binding MarR family transcriptional regulator
MAPRRDDGARPKVAADPMTADPGDRDDLDRRLLVWKREIPDLDPVTEGIVERLGILAHDFEASLNETLESVSLDGRSYHMLGKLRASGSPYRMTPGELARRLRLSSGAMTNRLDRMEAAGLIRRLPDPADRRGTLVEPTELGHATWDQAVGVQAQRERLLASVLDEDEREELHRLLRRLMRAFPNHAHAKKHATPDARQPDDAPQPPRTPIAGRTPSPSITPHRSGARASQRPPRIGA